jgi:DNA (cytosine-5)-methyltransferase 3A
LLIGGSPCQDLSVAKRNGKGLDGNKSGLFFEYLRILNKVKPKYFILENVASMKAIDRDKISKYLFDIEPIKICSSLLTAQMRKRLYWVGSLQEDGSYKKVDIQQPEDKGIVLKDIIESGDTERLKSYCITATYSRACPEDYFNHGQRQLIFKKPVRVGHFNKGGQGDRIYSVDGKSVCLSANGGGRGAKTGLYEIKELVRKLTPIECERLQGFPDNYSEGISNTQRYKALGNSFTVPIIKHILQNINGK